MSKPHLCQNGSEGRPCDEGSRRALAAQLVKGAGAAHQHLEDNHWGGAGGGNTHRNGGSDHKVNVEKLCVSKICFVAVQDEN